VGVGHLAFTSRDAHPDSIHDTDKEKVAEFGVSVSASARGHVRELPIFFARDCRFKISNYLFRIELHTIALA
jgi:hypothetical protein